MLTLNRLGATFRTTGRADVSRQSKIPFPSKSVSMAVQPQAPGIIFVELSGQVCAGVGVAFGTVEAGVEVGKGVIPGVGFAGRLEIGVGF